MTQKNIQEITILRDSHLLSQINPLQTTKDQTRCTETCILQGDHTNLTKSDEWAIVVKWISQLPKQYLYSLIEELAKDDNGHSSRHNHDCDQLTDRENEVLILVASGYSRAEIGSTLNISRNTAASHITNIYRKLDISTVAQATQFAISAGLLSI